MKMELKQVSCPDCPASLLSVIRVKGAAKRAKNDHREPGFVSGRPA